MCFLTFILIYIYILYQLKKHKEYNNAINGVPNSIALDLTSKISIKTKSMSYYLPFVIQFELLINNLELKYM